MFVCVCVCVCMRAHTHIPACVQGLLIVQLPELIVGQLTGLVGLGRMAYLFTTDSGTYYSVTKQQSVIAAVSIIVTTGSISLLFLQLRPTSIEKEVFPQMADDGNLFAMELQGTPHLVSLMD